MKKNIKTGILLVAIMFIVSIVGVNISNAGYCEDICTPREEESCTARGETCDGFENMKTIDPIDGDVTN